MADHFREKDDDDSCCQLDDYVRRRKKPIKFDKSQTLWKKWKQLVYWSTSILFLLVLAIKHIPSFIHSKARKRNSEIRFVICWSNWLYQSTKVFLVYDMFPFHKYFCLTHTVMKSAIHSVEKWKNYSLPPKNNFVKSTI